MVHIPGKALFPSTSSAWAPACWADPQVQPLQEDPAGIDLVWPLELGPILLLGFSTEHLFRLGPEHAQTSSNTWGQLQAQTAPHVTCTRVWRAGSRPLSFTW